MIIRDLVSGMQEVILRETLHHRVYVGKVVSIEDSLKKGRVKVTIPALGWSDESIGAWCRPRGIHSMIVPPVGSYVSVSFTDGNLNMGTYFGGATEMEGMVPAAFDGKQTTAVIWQDPKTGDFIVYDGENKLLTIGATKKIIIQVKDGSDSSSITFDSNGVILLDKNGNNITMSSGKVTVNGNLEVDQ